MRTDRRARRPPQRRNARWIDGGADAGHLVSRAMLTSACSYALRPALGSFFVLFFLPLFFQRYSRHDGLRIFA